MFLGYFKQKLNNGVYGINARYTIVMFIELVLNIWASWHDKIVIFRIQE